MNDPYKSSGVDIDAADRLIAAIGPLAKSTARSGADGALGGFGALFDLKAAGFTDPILVSGTDGVGTKLKLAFETGRHSTIGVDLVAMCVNDILAQGAEPLFFLDYFATGKLEEGVAKSVIAGIAEGCSQAGCALIGGETAEMPGMYTAGEYDLAGFCVGAVERADMLPKAISPGDVMIGIASSGPHSNGYSLIRKIISESGLALDAKAPFDSERTLGDAFLTPTRIYIKSLLPLIRDNLISAFAHITGGGLTENVPRVLGTGVTPNYDETALSLPPIFSWLQEEDAISTAAMHRTFNCGIGGVLICKPDNAGTIIERLNDAGESARIIGDLKAV